MIQSLLHCLSGTPIRSKSAQLMLLYHFSFVENVKKAHKMYKDTVDKLCKNGADLVSEDEDLHTLCPIHSGHSTCIPSGCHAIVRVASTILATCILQ